MRYAIAAVLLAGCGLYVKGDDDVTVGALQEVLVVPAMPTKDLDLLFVVDDSSSMSDKQAHMIESFPKFMDQLTSLPAGMPNVHIGVVTSDMGTRAEDGTTAPGVGGTVGGCNGQGKAGALQNANATTLSGRFISDVEAGSGGRMQNYTGELRDVFSAIATVGSSGCGFEQHIAATKAALDPANTANAGFLRPDANLGVIVLADEDDCSQAHAGLLTSDTTQLGPLQSFRCTRYGVTCDDGGTTSEDMNLVGPKSGCHANNASQYLSDVPSFVAFLKNLKADPSQVAFAAIVGPTTPFETELRAPGGSTQVIPALAHSCNSAQTEVADPAVRLAEVADQFGARGTVESICQADLSLPLTGVGLSMRSMMTSDGCLAKQLVDTNSDRTGIQPLCAVEDGGAAVPSCEDNASGDCWRAIVDGSTCPDSPDHLRIEIERAAMPISQRYAHVRCLVVH